MELTGNSLANRIIRSTLSQDQIDKAIEWVNEDAKKEDNDGNTEEVR